MKIPTRLFSRIEAEPIADIVVHQVEDLIVQGVLAEGDRLPSERDLWVQLNVSRPKLRDALKSLEHNGLIEVKHGEGTFVAQLTGQAMSPALINLYARQSRAFFDYLEYRRAQEAFAARLAAERATKSDRAEISRCLEELERTSDRDDSEAAKEADVQFHSMIVEASHNAMLVHMMTSIYELTRRGIFYNRNFLRTLDGSGEKLKQQHRDIAEAVLREDPDAAEASAKAHLDFVERSFRVGMDQEDNEAVSIKRIARLRGDQKLSGDAPTGV